MGHRWIKDGNPWGVNLGSKLNSKAARVEIMAEIFPV